MSPGPAWPTQNQMGILGHLTLVKSEGDLRLAQVCRSVKQRGQREWGSSVSSRRRLGQARVPRPGGAGVSPRPGQGHRNGRRQGSGSWQAEREVPRPSPLSPLRPGGAGGRVLCREGAGSTTATWKGGCGWEANVLSPASCGASHCPHPAGSQETSSPAAVSVYTCFWGQ